MQWKYIYLRFPLTFVANLGVLELGEGVRWRAPTEVPGLEVGQRTETPVFLSLRIGPPLGSFQLSRGPCWIITDLHGRCLSSFNCPPCCLSGSSPAYLLNKAQDKWNWGNRKRMAKELKTLALMAIFCLENCVECTAYLGEEHQRPRPKLMEL